MNKWYSSLSKSSLTPPPVVFSVVWPLLYMSLCIVGVRILYIHDLHRKHWVIGMFVLQLVLNFIWTTLFFRFQSPVVAFLNLIAIVFLTLCCMVALWKVDLISVMLLTPYFAWCCFASYLNLYIVIYSR